MRSPKIDPFSVGGGVEGFRREAMYPHGVRYGIGCQVHPGGGGLTCFHEKNIKTVLGFSFLSVIFRLVSEILKMKVSPTVSLTWQELTHFCKN